MKFTVFATLLATASAFSIKQADVAKVRNETMQLVFLRLLS
jgi:hypothetical protein